MLSLQPMHNGFMEVSSLHPKHNRGVFNVVVFTGVLHRVSSLHPKHNRGTWGCYSFILSILRVSLVLLCVHGYYYCHCMTVCCSHKSMDAAFNKYQFLHDPPPRPAIQPPPPPSDLPAHNISSVTKVVVPAGDSCHQGSKLCTIL